MVQCGVRGLLGCFGYPVAHEDAASRAGEAGLCILEEIKLLGDQPTGEHKLELNPWVGIHTGQAVVKTRDGVVSLIGEASNVAVRLDDVATTGQVVCTEATHRLLVSHFRCSSLGPHKIKGTARPVELFHVQTVLKSHSPIDSVERAGLTPLTGRDHEISLLKDRWEHAQEGMGQVVLLIGEAGLGKSRLVHTLKQFVQEHGHYSLDEPPVIEWRCSPHYQNTGLHPAIDFYERALGFGAEEPPQVRFERMQNRLAQYDLARPETLPLWASLLSLPIPDRFPPLALPPARQREETFRVMLEWLHVRAARQPTLFVVEDLHWVDASTLEFLGQFLAEGLHDRVLTLLTFRPEFQTPWPALAHQTSLALNRLTRLQVSELISKKTSRNLPEGLVDQIFGRTGLNAFRATGAQVRLPAYLCILGDAYTQCGRFEEAHNALDEGLTIADKNGDRCHEAELHRIKGELLLKELPDRPALAEVCFRRAIETAQRQLSLAWELRATTSLARLWHQQDRTDEAHIALAAVYSKYSEGFTTPDLVDAKKLLEELR